MFGINCIQKLQGLFIYIFFCIFSVTSVHAAPATPPGSFVEVCSAIVFDLDNDAILFEQNPDQRIPPASLTKILSMFLARDFIKNGHASLDSIVPVSKSAASEGGSRMGLHPNEELPFNKLLLGMAVSSGNDASYAVAEYVGGSAKSFVKMMNAKAKEIGMYDSYFQNPHGLPAEGQYTTARDMLTLARAYLRSYPDALDMHNTKILSHRGYTSWNKNPLLGQYPGADGLKTGWIRASGYNLIFTAEQGGKRLLAVILGAPDTYTRSAEACRLLDAGFMVCNNDAVSIAAALDTIPFDIARIDPRKTGREAALLRAKLQSQRVAAKTTVKKIRVMASKVKNTKAKSKASHNVAKATAKRKTHAESKVAKMAYKRS